MAPNAAQEFTLKFFPLEVDDFVYALKGETILTAAPAGDGQERARVKALAQKPLQAGAGLHPMQPRAGAGARLQYAWCCEEVPSAHLPFRPERDNGLHVAPTAEHEEREWLETRPSR